MNDYLLLMHDDVPQERRRPDREWEAWFAKLRERGAFQGGSAIGGGVCVTKAGTRTGITRHLSGYVRIRAMDLEAALELVAGNPVYEAGGTVELRELPRDR